MAEGCGCECCHEHEHEHEEQNGKVKLVRIIVSIVLLVAIWIIGEKTKLFGSVPIIIFYVVPYLIAGYDVLLGAVKNIFKGKIFDEKFLMAVASLGAFAIGEYAEAVAVMIFNQVGEMFEDYAVDKSHRSIAKLMDIVPEHAFVLRDGETLQISPKNVKVGETVVVKPGERIPLDGVVTDGCSTVDTSALTGESEPVSVGVGDEVLSGCVNLTGLIRVEVTKAYENSTVAGIMELVEHTSEKKTRAENFITKFARRYTPAVVAAAVLLFAVPSIITGDWQSWLRRALVFLVVSCPCALVVSVPLSFFSGIGAASRKGILIKGSNYIDALSKVNTFVFDKTGTLTKGEFSVIGVTAQGMSEEQLLGLAALCESGSAHPVARSIVKTWNKPTNNAEIESLQEFAGEGVAATVKGKTVYVGNEKLMKRAGAKIVHCKTEGTAVYTAIGSEYIGCITVSDTVKDGAAKAVQQLKRLGIKKTVMLTGDNEMTAGKVADVLGIDEFYANLLPADKVDKVEQLLEEGSLAFVGDGINDAPVLARADVGIAMGTGGSDAAIEAADVVLMDDKPEKAALAVKISRRTMNIVRQNIVFALGVKVLIMLLGAIGVAGMWAAVFADVGVLVLAVLNAMRGLKVPKEK